MTYTIRKATLQDRPALEALITLSARILGTKDYTTAQIEGALRGAFGVDTDLIRDGTYFVAEAHGQLIGCGGWSRRRTLFGGDQHANRDASKLDPSRDAARIRAFFTHPDWVRRGIAQAILARCEAEARGYGFCTLDLMATLPGLKFYLAQGYAAAEPVPYELAPGLVIQFVPMKKALM